MKILAVGMNYLEHNLALHGAAVKPERPVLFMKSDSAVLKNGKPFFIPDNMGRIEYETEVVVRICRLGKCIPQKFAHRYYDAYTVGIDLTARELQKELKAKGQPWELAKGFDGSRRRSFSAPSASTSTSTSMARPSRPVARPICSIPSTSSSAMPPAISRSRRATSSIRVAPQAAAL